MSLSKKAAEKRRLAEKRKELRKEKSKEAARNRRGKEGEFFAELADTLPLANSLKQSLDKSTVIKLCINYMRLRELLQDVFPATNVSQKLPLNIFSMRDEFELVLSLSPFGDIVYATDNVKDLLGLYQYDMIGCGLSTLMHPSDWNEFEEFYKSGESSISVTARFKSSLAAKSRSTANGKNPQYKTVKFIGRRLTAPSSSSPGKDSKDGCVILTGSPVETLAVSEQVIDSMTFTCKHTLSMRLTDCDERFTELTRYPAGYAKEKSFYSFVHPGDMKSVETHFKSLYSKETIQTEPYRLLTGYGGYVEVVTVASLVNNLKTGKPEAITSIHHVICRIEESDKIWADIQLVDMADSIKAECVSPGLSNSPESNDIAEEDKAYDDIFNATANCFTDIRCPDIMADTESVLEPIKPIDQQMTLNKSGILSGTLDPSDSHNLDDLEAIFEKYDGSCLTSNGCFYDDLPDLTDDEDLSSRAPYIPLEINEDLEGLSPVDMKEFPVELQLKPDLANRAPYIPTIDLEELAMAESCCLDVDTESTLPSSSVGSNWTLNSSGHYRDQCHTDLSPDAPVSWQVDTSPGSTLSSVNSPTTSHDHLAAQVDSGQVYSPQEEISRCLDETLVVASEGSPVSSLLDENLFLAVNPQNVGESRMTHSAEVNGYKTATTFSPPDQRRYTHNQRKRKAGDLYTISASESSPTRKKTNGLQMTSSLRDTYNVEAVLGAGLASGLDSKVIARGHAIGGLLVPCSSNSSDDIICNFNASGAGERNWSGECARSSSISPLNLPLTFYTEKSEALDNSLPFKKSRIAKNSDYLLHSNDLQFLFDDVPSQKVSLHGTAEILEDRGGGKSPNSIISLDYWL